jgi:hypothetical protein
MEQWYAGEGDKNFMKVADEEWQWYVEKVLKPKALATGMSMDALLLEARKAVIHDSPMHHTGVDRSNSKIEVVEPRDQRWPTSTKV